MAKTGSFIPTQNPKRKKPTFVKRRRVYILNYVVYIAFIIVLFLAAGLFAWEQILKNNLQDQQADLVELQNAFSPSDIMFVRETERVLEETAKLLDRTPASSQIFTALETVIADGVLVRSLSLSDDSAVDSAQPDAAGISDLAISIEAETESFGRLLAQRNILRSSNTIFQDARLEKVTYLGVELSPDEVAALAEEGMSVPTVGVVDFVIALPLEARAILYDGTVPAQLAPATTTGSAAEVST